MVKINKPSTPSAKTETSPGGEEKPNADITSSPTPKELFREDRAEAQGVSPSSPPVDTHSAVIAPPKKSRSKERSSSPPPLPPVTDDSSALPDVPSSELFRTPWAHSHNREDVPSSELSLMQPEYNAISEMHNRLSNLKIDLEQPDLDYAPSGFNLAPRPSGSQKNKRDVFRQQLERYRTNVEQFTLKLKPEVLTLHPQRNRVKNKIIAALNKLPNLDAIAPVHAPAYSNFVNEHGITASINHKLHSTMDVLEHRLDQFESEQTILQTKRTHSTDLLSLSLTSDQLKTVLEEVETLNDQFKDHLATKRNLSTDLDAFVSQVEEVTVTETVAREIRAQVAQEKTGLLTRLNSIHINEGTNPPVSTSFNTFQNEVGVSLAITSGVQAQHDHVATLIRANRKEYRNLTNRLRTLKEEIKLATSLEDLHRLSRPMESLTRKTQVHQNSLTTELKGFQSLLQAIEKVTEKHKLDKLLVRVSTAEEMLNKAPTIPHPKKPPINQLKLSDLTSPKAVQDRNRLNQDFKTLEKSHTTLAKLKRLIQRNIPEATSRDKVVRLEYQVASYVKMVSNHYVLLQTFLREQQELLNLIQPSKTPTLPPGTPVLSDAAERLVEITSGTTSSLARTIYPQEIKLRDGTVVNITVGDRIDAMTTLRLQDPSASLDEVNRHGNSLPHVIVGSVHLTELEKISLLRHVQRAGCYMSQVNPKNQCPLGYALLLQDFQPRLVETLRKVGATLTDDDQYPVIAHLLGVGGAIETTTYSGPEETSLEGLPRRTAEFMLDPVVRKVLEENLKHAPDGMKRALALTYSNWSDTRNASSFSASIRRATKHPKQSSFDPRVLITGWYKPSGHAVGFVFNREPDGFYLYACNAGSSKDPTRSVVKYKVIDFEKTAAFFDTFPGDNNAARRFFTEDTSQLGLVRLATPAQIPYEIDKSSQKRGNCPMASRKACLLAMLWSCSRSENVPPETVKATYKKLTTGFRQEGVAQAIASGSSELMGKALVSMLTKFDRPQCKDLAYDLADALFKQSNPGDRTRSPGPPRHLPEQQEWTFLKKALLTGKQNPRSLKTKRGESLATFALRKKNLQAFNVLQGITKGASSS